jgi:hypothetical protein
MLRFTSLSFSMRRIEEDGTTLIGDKGQVFTFSEGDMIVCYTRSTHLDEEVYRRSQVHPGTVYGGRKAYQEWQGSAELLYAIWGRHHHGE